MSISLLRTAGLLVAIAAAGATAAISVAQERPAGTRLKPIPDKLVVLTFDDSKASHYTVVRPLLKKYRFGATFFITEGFAFRTNKEDYLTWEQIGELHREGFEIGNHTRDHRGVAKLAPSALGEQIEAINARCAAHGIPAPVSFAYPGNAIDASAFPVLEKFGFRFARRGGAPEHPYEEGNGVAYEPGRDHPLLLPSAGDARPAWTLENLKRAVSQARNGNIAILQFHGAPDVEHPWVHTPPERFEEYMRYLHDEGFTAIAMRDLAAYVDWRQKPDEPWKIIDQRKSELSNLVR
jgi:peptidoglycan/xylan/chitin deacetylase (PgdA/CDA1 family)